MGIRLPWCALALCFAVSPVWASRDLKATIDIRQECAQFDAQSQGVTRRHATVFGMAHEGSEITALEFKGQTRKLYVEHLGTMGRAQETIYLKNGRPIWVTRIETTYDAPLSGRVVERQKESLYFQNGQLIQRDFTPVTLAKGTKSRKDRIHQTSISSPAQARTWKAKALDWARKVALYKSELSANQPQSPTPAATATKTSARSATRKA